MSAVLTTIQHRPYVVAFLLTFLLLATLHIGVLRTLLWLVWGYTIAFLSEYSSIHNGFPYGLYHYIAQGFAGELALAGVPVWDSISYPFIAYASYATAWFLCEPTYSTKSTSPEGALRGRLRQLRWWRGRREPLKIAPHVSPSKPFKVVCMASFLMMLADIIIDPTANLGEKWFLGKVYFYPEGGIYFDVPLSNFAGWLLVGFAILAGWQILEKFLWATLKLPTWGAKRFPFQGFLGSLFYFGILGFMLAIQIWIGAHSLFAVSAVITIALVLMVTQKIKRPFYRDFNRRNFFSAPKSWMKALKQ